MQIAIVTGCSTGIGYATALRLAREGCRVHATVRSEASGSALLAEASGLPLTLLLLDVNSDASVAAGIASVLAAEGRVDILVNNAGIADGDAIEVTPIATFESVMNTNAWGPVRCMQAVLPAMREQRSGCIVNVTSLAGRVALGGLGAYAGSKFALEAISDALAIEVAPFGIRVAIIEPGVVVTPIFEKGSDQPIDFESPYFEMTFRTSRFLMAGLMNPASPETAADVIWNAVASPSATVRRTVGEDAATTVSERAKVSDEAWLSGFSTPDDAQWRSNMLAWTGTEVPPM